MSDLQNHIQGLVKTRVEMLTRGPCGLVEDVLIPLSKQVEGDLLAAVAAINKSTIGAILIELERSPRGRRSAKAKDAGDGGQS